MSAEEKVRGIILRARPYSDTSLIIQWITRDLGLLSTMAKGARRGKSPFYGRLDLFFEADFSMLRRASGSLHLLKEVAPLDTVPQLRTSMVKLAMASYAALVIEYNVETETPVAGVFELMKDHLESLKLPGATARRLLYFEWKLLVELGLASIPKRGEMSAGTIPILEFILRNPLGAANRLRPSEGQTEEMRRFLTGRAGEAGLRLPGNRERLLATPS